MQDTLVSVKIIKGYAAWMLEKDRAVSKKIEFGTWWRLKTMYWRVSWIETTGELYAVERPPSDRFVLLAHLGKKEVNELMRKWMDGDNLEALFQRFAAPPVEEKPVSPPPAAD